MQSSKVENAECSQKDLEDVVKLLIRLSDEDQGFGLARDPVAPAVRSVQALKKVHPVGPWMTGQKYTASSHCLEILPPLCGTPVIASEEKWESQDSP